MTDEAMPGAIICKACNKSFSWSAEDLAFYNKLGYEPLELCVDCGHQQRLAHRNEMNLYKRVCDGTGESIISIYAPNTPYTVYSSEYYWSDKWDPLDHGLDIDFARPFFEQLNELKKKVPRIALNNIRHQNSDYCNFSVGNKNSYMMFGSDFNEDCMFGRYSEKNRSSLDIDSSYRNELCYYCSDIVNCYDSRFLFNSSNCSNMYFCDECTGSSECILSFNLKQKQYCIENQQYSKEEYFKRKTELINNDWENQEKLIGRFKELRVKQTVRFAHIINSQNSTGDYIKNSKNCTNCFDITDSEDCRSIIYGSKIKDCFYSSNQGVDSELCFNTLANMYSQRLMGSIFVVSCSEVYYSDNCVNSSYLFGCIGINHKKYCILNKQYDKKNYEKLVARLIEHMKQTDEWGYYPSPETSCFGYNETVAAIYFPLSKEQALAKGFLWRDEVDSIREKLEDVVLCNICNKNFRVISQELKWYKSQKIPLPHECPRCRIRTRRAFRNLEEIWQRKCAGCQMEIFTTYSPERPEKVYCEQCYLKTVY